MKLKLITFDVSNTLLRIRGSVGNHYAMVANKYYGATGKIFEEDATENAFIQAYKVVSKLMPNFGYHNQIAAEKWWYEVVHRVFFSLGLRDIGIMKSISNQLYTDYCTKTNYELYPEVQHVLKTLKSRNDIKLGVISNFDERLDLLLEQLNIRQYFDLVLSSRSVGIAKPDKRIFETMLMLIGGEIKPNEALHIGDSVECDYKSAIKAGFNALLINRSNKPKANSSSDINTISTLVNLFEYIQVDNVEPLKGSTCRKKDSNRSN
eukprot:gene15692-17274_t